MIVNCVGRNPIKPVAEIFGTALKGAYCPHNLKEHRRSNVFRGMPVEEPPRTVAEDSLVVHPVQPGKGRTVAARLPYQDILLCFAVCQINASHYQFFVSFSHHRNYKRRNSQKRCIKSRRPSEFIIVSAYYLFEEIEYHQLSCTLRIRCILFTPNR